MTASREVDWVSAWYDIWAVFDATLNFWLTATFAVIVAIHALGERATVHVTRPIAALYAAFSIYTALRAIGIEQEAQKVIAEVSAADINLFEFYSGMESGITTGSVAYLILQITFVVGSIYTVYFVLSAPKRAGT